MTTTILRMTVLMRPISSISRNSPMYAWRFPSTPLTRLPPWRHFRPPRILRLRGFQPTQGSPLRASESSRGSPEVLSLGPPSNILLRNYSTQPNNNPRTGPASKYALMGSPSTLDVGKSWVVYLCVDFGYKCVENSQTFRVSRCVYPPEFTGGVPAVHSIAAHRTLFSRGCSANPRYLWRISIQ